MPTVTVNGTPVTFGENEKLNCVQAAQRAGMEIPHYCWHPELSVVASCRMCLVEVGDTKPDGSVAMQPKLFPGCQTPVKDGMVVVSNSPKVETAQKATLEYLLLNHPLDCPVCDQAGECGLQDYSYEYGRGYSRLDEPKNLKPDKDYIGEQITLFTDRCIMCTRCVRFTREFSGTGELQVINRGSKEEIDIFPGEPCDNKLSGNVVDLCPVGALCSKDFLYQQRVWWLKGKDSACAGCSNNCSIRIDQNNDTVYRVVPRPNPRLQAGGHFMCDDGRFGWKYVHSENRLTQPSGPGGVTDWTAVLTGVRETLVKGATENPKRVAAIISPWATVEEAYLLCSYLKSLSPDIRIGLGPVRVVGEDDTYPKDPAGRPVEPVRFTIRAEKCPNRSGVEAVLQHFQGTILQGSQLVKAAGAGELDVVCVLGGDPELGYSDDDVAALSRVKTLIVEDLLASPLTRAATYVLAGGSWAEKDGTIVNHQGLAQAIRRAIRGPGDARQDGRILSELAQRRGLYHATTIRQELAGVVPALAALIVGDLGDEGIDLTGPAAPVATLQTAGSSN